LSSLGSGAQGHDRGRCGCCVCLHLVSRARVRRRGGVLDGGARG
jgi:hypothetical protein